MFIMEEGSPAVYVLFHHSRGPREASETKARIFEGKIYSALVVCLTILTGNSSQVLSPKLSLTFSLKKAL